MALVPAGAIPSLPPVFDEVDVDRALSTFVLQERERGTGGVLYVRDQTCAYLFPDDERFPEPFREQLHLLLDRVGATTMVIVREKQRRLDVFQYAKADALQRLSAGMDAVDASSEASA